MIDNLIVAALVVLPLIAVACAIYEDFKPTPVPPEPWWKQYGEKTEKAAGSDDET